jgi:hypothetical protein
VHVLGEGPLPEKPEMPDAVSDDLAWRTSRRSSARGTGVEVAPLPDGGMAVRDSRHREGAVLVYTRAEVTAFLLGAKDGDFDDLLEPA